MARRNKEDERLKLTALIKEWNANRLDLFALSQPNEELEFFGVMRFFYQDEGAKVATKCIRVSSTATTNDVLGTLVEKFRPDMRMLSLPQYSLYEVHVNGEERKLNDHERPLFMQLEWGKDDREGRFLLKREDDKTALSYGDLNQNTQQSGGDPNQTIEGEFQRGGKKRLSKKEKKEIKKKEKEAKLKGKENTSPKDGGVAEKLYNELPETSFSRTISNPEAVMRRRRQLKLERKLAQFKSKDGGPDSGGTLKIYGETLFPDVPYKTLLLSTSDPAAFVVMETLNKYGKEKENPDKYCIIQVMMPPEGPNFNAADIKEYLLDDEDCPLAIVMEHAHFKGKIMFHLRRRTADMPKKKKKKNREEGDMSFPYDPTGMTPMDRLPFLVEINHDGSEPYKALKFRLPVGNTEVGSERNMTFGGHYLQIFGSDIFPRHCVVTHQEGLVTVTPVSKDAEVYINGQRIYENTVLQPGMAVRFGKLAVFRFHDPALEPAKGPGAPEQAAMQQRPPGYPAPPHDPSNFETNFDVDGHIETVTGATGPGKMDDHVPQKGFAGPTENILPASLEYREEGEDAFLAAVVSEVNGQNVQFKLAPTYTLYMTVRYRIAKLAHVNNPNERAHWIGQLVIKISHMIRQTIQENRGNAAALSFWMANASELLHFFNQDRDVSPASLEGQDILASSVEMAFQSLVHCMQGDLNKTMPAFLDESLDDLQAEDDLQFSYPHPGTRSAIGEVIQVLSSAMSLLRRCRVNAALTIQLFSQLFHFVNMWLFNKVVAEPRLQLCTRAWGHKLKRRLGRIEIWAEKQGLELAADCHLARIIQAAHLLEAPKSSADDIASISSTCFKLNSIQLRALLENYIPGPGEPRIPHDLIDSVVSVAQNTADELTRSDGRDIQLEEEPDLQLPFLLPEDGYSCDIVKNVPSGLAEFLDPLGQTGICRMIIHSNAIGVWTVYFQGFENQENLQAGGGLDNQKIDPNAPSGMPRDPDVINVTFPKVKGSMGLSIVAAKGEGQKDRGIYIKSVVTNGAAAQDGRLAAGDQLLEVDGTNLVGLTQEKAAELMTRTGQVVNLKVAKNGAIYHGLAQLLSQPSPIMQRDPNRASGMPHKGRPKSEDVSRFNNVPQHPDMMDPRARNLQNSQLARSSPALHTARSQEQLPDHDPYNSYRGGPPPQSAGPYPGAPAGYSRDPRDAASRSKSTSNLDQREPDNYDYRQTTSTSTLPRSYPQQPAGPAPQQRPPFDNNRAASQPDLNKREEDPRNNSTYENYPGARPAPDKYPRDQYNQPNYVNQNDIRNQYMGPQKGMPPSRSMGNIPDQPRQEPGRPKSEELDHSRVREWQQRNEMAEQQKPGYNPYGQSPYNNSQGPPGPDTNRQYDPRSSDPRQGGPQDPRLGGPQDPRQGGPQDPRQGGPQDPRQGGPQDPRQAGPQDPRLGGPSDPRAGGPQDPRLIGQHDPRLSGPQDPRLSGPQDPRLSGPQDPRHAGPQDPRQGPPDGRPKPGLGPKPIANKMDEPRSDRGYPGSPYQQDSQTGGYYPTSQAMSQPPSSQPQGGHYSATGPGMTPTSQGPPSSLPQSPYAQVQSTRYQQSQTTIERTYKNSSSRLQGMEGKPKGPSDLPPAPAADMPPDLPPPPPPEDQRGFHPEENHMPPPPPPAEFEARMREEQLMKQMGRYMGQQDQKQQDQRQGQGAREPGPPDMRRDQHPPTSHPQDMRGSYGDRYSQDHAKPAPASHRPNGSNPSYSNYQNMPASSSSPYGGMSTTANPMYAQSESRAQYESQPAQSDNSFSAYPYAPRPAPAESIPPASNARDSTNEIEKSLQELSMIQNESQNAPPKKKPPPPIKAKPKIVIPDAKKGPSPSPWEREEKENEKKRKEAETRMRRDQEILRLEQKTYLSQEEQDRLKRLRLDREFDRRVLEASQRQEDDEDGDMAERAAGRAKMLQMIQDDLNKRQQQQNQDKEQRDRMQDVAEKEKTERQERRLQQFEQEREEQKRRDQKKMEKRMQETEDYLRKQRELRERQRIELDEARRIQREQDEKLKQRQREEIQKKKEMEKEQMRALQDAREEEERMARRPEGDRSQGYPYRSEDNSMSYQDPRDRFIPQPPERKSSYDVYGKNNSMSQLPSQGAGSPADMSLASRSMSSSALRAETNGQGSAKKSVSFNANIVTEIHDTRYFGSTSSESSLNPQSPYATSSHGEFQMPQSSGYQSTPPSFSQAPSQNNSQTPPKPSAGPSPGYSQAPSQRYSQPMSQGYSSQGQGVYSQAPGQYSRPEDELPPPPPNMSTFPARGSSSGSSTSDAPAPFHRQFTGPNGPSTPQGANEVFDPRTPDYKNPATFVSGDTPGVVGAQEVYRDPRDRIAAQRQGGGADNGPIGERMSFRDKMKMFAKEAGENTPNDKLKISRAQQRVEAQLQSPPMN